MGQGHPRRQYQAARTLIEGCRTESNLTIENDHVSVDLRRANLLLTIEVHDRLGIEPRRSSMSASGISAAASPPHSHASQHAGHHRNRTHGPSISDIDAQSTSAAAGKSVGKPGSTVNLKV
jgi:hypothetical protein